MELRKCKFLETGVIRFKRIFWLEGHHNSQEESFMKRILFYLLLLWRWIRIPILILALILIALYYIITMGRVEYQKGCIHENRTVSSSQQGVDAVVEEVFCGGGFGGGDIATIKLHGRAGLWNIWSKEVPIFVYHISNELGVNGIINHEPMLVWLSVNELEISVDHISQIIYQKEEVRGVNITYKIGKVDYP